MLFRSCLLSRDSDRLDVLGDLLLDSDLFSRVLELDRSRVLSRSPSRSASLFLDSDRRPRDRFDADRDIFSPFSFTLIFDLDFLSSL